MIGEFGYQNARLPLVSRMTHSLRNATPVVLIDSKSDPIRSPGVQSGQQTVSWTMGRVAAIGR